RVSSYEESIYSRNPTEKSYESALRQATVFTFQRDVSKKNNRSSIPDSTLDPNSSPEPEHVPCYGANLRSLELPARLQLQLNWAAAGRGMDYWWQRPSVVRQRQQRDLDSPQRWHGW